ncbi:MAG: NUDIX domain-containing protein [Parvibaculaceae bacterium]|nr:NUDIX domain-containing protein [Parvibaculaceae bacterium]
MRSARSLAFSVLRPLVQLWFRLRRPLTAGVRAMIFDEAGRVLLVRHTYIDGWYMPGGGVDRNETMLAAVRREVDEETGVLIEADVRLSLFGLYGNFRAFKSDHIALYIVPHGTYSMVPRESPEIAEMGFFALDALPADTTPGTHARLLEVARGEEPAELW